MTVTDNSPRVGEATLPEGVCTTFTSSCAYGCVVRTVDGQEQPHICVGQQLVAGLAPGLTFELAKRIADGLRPLVRELQAGAWEDGVRSGRRGLCAGVDNDVPEHALPPADIVSRAQEETWSEAASLLTDLAAPRGNDQPLTDLVGEFEYRAAAATRGTCVACGCTDDRACPDGCSWSRPGLCSACTVMPERLSAATR